MTVQSQFLKCVVIESCNYFAMIFAANANFIPFTISCFANQMQDCFVGYLLIVVIYLECYFEAIEHFVGIDLLIFLSFNQNQFVSCWFSIKLTNLLVLLNLIAHLIKFISISFQCCINSIFYFQFIQVLYCGLPYLILI